MKRKPIQANPPLAEAATLLAVLLCAILLAAGLSAGRRVAAFPADRLLASGLFALQYRPDGRPYRWAGGESALSLPNPGGATRLTLHLTGGRDTEAHLAGPVGAVLPLEARPRSYSLLLPPQTSERFTLRLSVPTFQTSDDPRELGLILDKAVVRGGGRAPTSLLMAAVLCAAALYAALRTATARATAAIAAVALVGALLIWQRLGLWPAQSFGPLAAVVTAIAAVVAVCWRVALVASERLRAAPRGRLSLHPALAGGLLSAYLGLGMYNHLVVHPRLDADLLLYVRAGNAMLEGRSPYAIFDLSVIGEAFVYSPATLPLFAALAAIDISAVQSLWLIGNLTLYGFALLALVATLPNVSRTDATALLILGMGFGPALEGLAIGQVNHLMLLGLTAFMLGHNDRRLSWAGDAALAAVILIKLTPAVVLLWPLARGDWPRLGRVAIAGALLCVPALLLYGLWPWVEHLGLIPELLQGVRRNAYNLAIAGVLTELSTPGSWGEAAAAWIGRAVSLLLLGAWATVCLWRREGGAGRALAFGVTVLTVASSLVWYHHLVFLAVPLAWLGLAGSLRERWAALAGLALIQSARLVEVELGVPPLTATVGYLVIAVAMGRWVLWPAAERRPPK